MTMRRRGLLQEILAMNEKKKNKNKLECQSVMPFRLIENNGKPFSVVGFSKGCFFESSFFTLISVDETSQCVELEVLTSVDGLLLHTQARVIVNLRCFCGVEIVCSPVYDCLQVSRKMHEHFCCPFMLTKEEFPKVLWCSIQKHVANTGMISVNACGIDCQVELMLCMDDGVLTMIVPKGECQTITVSNLQSIQVSQPIDQIEGVVDMRMIFHEEKEVYF